MVFNPPLYISFSPRPSARGTSFQGTQRGVDTHRVDVSMNLQALEEFQSHLPTSNSSHRGLVDLDGETCPIAPMCVFGVP